MLICIECDAVFSSRKELQHHQKTKHAFRTGDESDEEHMSTFVAEAALQPTEAEGLTLIDGLTRVDAGGSYPQRSSSNRPERGGHRGRGRGRGGGGGRGGDGLLGHEGRSDDPHYISGQHDQLKMAPAPRVTGSARGPRGPRAPPAADERSGHPEGAHVVHDTGGPDHPPRGTSGRADRTAAGAGRRGRGRGRGGREATSEVDPAPNPPPKLLMRPASAHLSVVDRAVDYRAVPGPTVGAASEAAVQDAVALNQVDATAAALAAIKGVGRGRRKNPTRDPHGPTPLSRGGGHMEVSEVAAAAPGDDVGSSSRRQRLPRGESGRPKGMASPLDAADVGIGEGSPRKADRKAPLKATGQAKPQQQRAVKFVTCPVCGSNFYKPAQLQQHMRSDHPGTDVTISHVPQGLFSSAHVPSLRKTGASAPLAGEDPAIGDSALNLNALNLKPSSQSWADMDDS